VAFDTSIRNGNAEQTALVARQPLLNRTLLTQSRQLDLSAEMAVATMAMQKTMSTIA